MPRHPVKKYMTISAVKFAVKLADETLKRANIAPTCIREIQNKLPQFILDMSFVCAAVTGMFRMRIHLSEKWLL